MVWTERENDYRIDKNPRGPVWWLLVAVFLVVVGVMILRFGYEVLTQG